MKDTNEFKYTLSVLDMLVEISPIFRAYDKKLSPELMTDTDGQGLKEILELLERFSAILGKKYIKYLEYKLEENHK